MCRGDCLFRLRQVRTFSEGVNIQAETERMLKESAWQRMWGERGAETAASSQAPNQERAAVKVPKGAGDCGS